MTKILVFKDKIKDLYQTMKDLTTFLSLKSMRGKNVDVAFDYYQKISSPKQLLLQTKIIL